MKKMNQKWSRQGEDLLPFKAEQRPFYVFNPLPIVAVFFDHCLRSFSNFKQLLLVSQT